MTLLVQRAQDSEDLKAQLGNVVCGFQLPWVGNVPAVSFSWSHEHTALQLSRYVDVDSGVEYAKR